MNRLFAIVLFLNHFGVTPPGFRHAISAWNSKQYCGVWFVFLKLNCDSLKWYLWNQGINTTGLKKQCLVRLSTNVNNISVELKAVRQADSWRSQRQKKKEVMVEKKRDLDLEQIGEGVGNGSKWCEWMNILAIATHGKQIKTWVKRKICKYPLSQVWKYCLKIMPPNQTTSSGHRAINKQFETAYKQKWHVFYEQLQWKTNNGNPGTSNLKTCALVLLNNSANGPVVMNHG